MKTITILTEKELKKFSKENKIKSINGVEFNSLSPELSNKNAIYYDVDSQSYKSFYSPFIVSF